MIWLEVLFLAVVQGIGEFMPISSSGHVVVGMALFARFGRAIPENEMLSVNIMLHMGTLLSILVFYRQRIWRLLGEDRRVIRLLLVGSLPAGVVGIAIKTTQFGQKIEQTVLDNPLVAGLMFPITGLMLLWSARRDTGQTTCRELGYGRALVVGALQAFAILPGISRSGATIVAGLGCGLRRDEAAAFSFLLAIPAISGAGLLETVKLLRHPTESTPPAALALGTLLSFAVGLASLWCLVRWLRQGRLHYFAWWVIPLGLAVTAWQLL
jgi:undecaprenyl-diphosphatase